MEADMSKSKPMPITEFMALFPDDDACLEHLFKARFGADHECSRCGESGKWKKLGKMPAYTCQCGNHVHPMVGTPFHKSHTPLQKWFYAMYLFTTTRHGVSAKELQRQLSVNYKTAWRMGHEIRKYLDLVDGEKLEEAGPLRFRRVILAELLEVPALAGFFKADVLPSRHY
jgi:transposase